MAYFNTDQILSQNGNLSTDEWIIKAKTEPGFLSRRYLLPSISTAVMRQAVLGYFMEGSKMQAQAMTFEQIFMPPAEARAGLGMYGKADVNYSTQVNTVHQLGGIHNVINNQPILTGQEVKGWDTIGNDRINFQLNSQLSVTRKFVDYTVRMSDIPQAIEIAIGNILAAIVQAYEDIYIIEFMAKGVNLNNEYLHGDPTRPVCKYVQNVTEPVDVHFDQSSPSQNRNNAMVQLINNINTYMAEIGLNQPTTEMIVAPIFVNNLKNSANWVFNSYQNVQQTQEMRTGIIGEILNGCRLFQAPRMSARYGSVVLNGKKCPDFFIVDRSKIMIPTLIVESLHMVPAPETYFGTILIKALEYFGVYAFPITIEDYQAQLNGIIRSSAISYGYLFTNPSVLDVSSLSCTVQNKKTISELANAGDTKGLNYFDLNIAGVTYPNPDDSVGVKLIKVKCEYASPFATGDKLGDEDATQLNEITPDGIRVFLRSTVVPASTSSVGVSIGVISDYYQKDELKVTLTFLFENETARDVEVTLKRQLATAGSGKKPFAIFEII